MSDDTLPVLLAIQRDIGELNGTLKAHVSLFEQHVQDDRKAYIALIDMKTEQVRQSSLLAQHSKTDEQAWTDITTLKDSLARQKGFVAAMGAMGGGVIAALGYVLDKILGH